jgi:hypothetical protein
MPLFLLKVESLHRRNRNDRTEPPAPVGMRSRASGAARLEATFANVSLYPPISLPWKYGREELIKPKARCGITIGHHPDVGVQFQTSYACSLFRPPDFCFFSVDWFR